VQAATRITTAGLGHHPAATLPSLEVAKARIRVLAGSAFGETSPVKTFSPLFYADVMLPAGRKLPLPNEHEERAAYVIDGTIGCGRERAESAQRARPDDGICTGGQAALHAITDARVALLGGAPLDGERHIWWNFVSSSKDRIEQAKEDWKEGRFPKVPGDEAEFIPLPE
jgi:redox-sensitive bicupin YhaK (pirin superfamily)